jgi:N-acetylglucosaminyldiphosphoundecaprenol N-acetyl-beta-D-mannosaminyltransferase
MAPLASLHRALLAGDAKLLTELFTIEFFMTDLAEDLTRNVFSLLGVPVDNIGMREALDRIETAINAKAPFLVSTPNVNFIVNAFLDDDFKNTLIFSDLCLPDGMWLVRLGRLLGIPLADRVAGADLLEALKSRRGHEDPFKLCFFGGSDAAGQQALQAINARGDGLRCVDAVNPGFGSIEEMSAPGLLARLNSSQADFLLVALGAKKGQAWLHANHFQLATPVRAHLGAAINFYAGAIKRAPQRLQRWGFEWAWRIKEEPLLWRRYAYDGGVIALMLLQRAAPLLAWSIYLRLLRHWVGEAVTVEEHATRGRRVISLAGALTDRNAKAIASTLGSAIGAQDELVLDLSRARAVDARFAGLLWMLQKTLARRGQTMRIEGAPILIRWLLTLYGFEIPRPTSQDNPAPANGVPFAAAE